MKLINMSCLLFCLLFENCLFGQVENADTEIELKIQEITEYINNGGDLNESNDFGVRYYQHYIWSYGFYGDTTELPIVRFLLQQDQKLEDVFWFINDPSPDLKNYVFNYVLLIQKNGYELKLSQLIEIFTTFYLESFGFICYIDYLDYYDKTPLMYACEIWNKELIKRMLIYGADLHFKNSRGQSAFDFCDKKKLKKIVKGLK